MAVDLEQNNRKITFRNFDIPALFDRTYTLSVTQHVHIKTDKEDMAKTFQRSQTFSVNGPQFALPVNAVQSVFPPHKSEGDYSNVLPHLILDKSTLPWERKSQSNGEDNVPWLALLLFDEAQQPQVENLTVQDITAASEHSPFWPGGNVSVGQNPQDRVQVIDVPKNIALSILPKYSELKYLSHVRQEKDQNEQPLSQPTAVVVSNRLPQKEKLTTVHLVSLENRFIEGEFNFQSAQDNDKIRFISLYSWQFYCRDKEQLLLGLWANLNQGLLRLPQNANVHAEKYLQQGSALLAHHTRTGDHLYSWYHGPLTPGITDNNPSILQQKVRSADQLLVFDPTTAMFDISYAAAWELGRLLALKDKNFSIAFYQWKRNHIYALHQVEQQMLYENLPFSQLNQGNLGDIPQAVVNFFQDLRYLKGVPFNYLVPDERSLPQESMRFFSVDATWTDYLIHGAFSIGRVTSVDAKRDEKMVKKFAIEPQAQLTGFMLRSQIVPGWPDLEISAFNKAGEELTKVQSKKISHNILLLIFQGEIQKVVIKQKPQSIHFGFSFPDNTHLDFYKKLRQQNGEYYTDPKYLPIEWNNQSLRVVNIAKLTERMATSLEQQTLPPYLFAMEMIEGVPQVIFQVDQA